MALNRKKVKELALALYRVKPQGMAGSAELLGWQMAVDAVQDSVVPLNLVKLFEDVTVWGMER